MAVAAAPRSSRSPSRSSITACSAVRRRVPAAAEFAIAAAAWRGPSGVVIVRLTGVRRLEDAGSGTLSSWPMSWASCKVAQQPLSVAGLEAELQRVEVAAEALGGERLPARGVLGDVVEVVAAVGERAVELRRRPSRTASGLLLGEVAADRPHRVDHRQAGPRASTRVPRSYLSSSSGLSQYARSASSPIRSAASASRSIAGRSGGIST